MGSIWSREPAVIIGAAITVLLNIVATLLGAGFISDALAGNITDVINGLGAAVLALLPLITAVLIRQKVSPAT